MKEILATLIVCGTLLGIFLSMRSCEVSRHRSNASIGVPSGFVLPAQQGSREEKGEKQ